MAVSGLLVGGSPLSSLHGRRKQRSSRYHFVTAALSIIFFLLVRRSVLPSSRVANSKIQGEKRANVHYEDPVAYNESLQLSRLWARAGDPNVPPWTQRVTTVLYCMMGDDGTTQSTFTTNDIERYGWQRVVLSSLNGQDFRDNTRGAYDDATLGTNIDTEEVIGYMAIEVWYDSDDNNQEIEPTNANFQNIVNTAAGYMVAGNNLSPRELEDDMETKAPPLQKWSDFMAFDWVAGSPLNIVIRSGITNDNTKSMIKQAHITAGQTAVRTYPGIDFSMSDDNTAAQTEAFYGLLGTYHAAGPAYMLLQHRAVFGKRRIERIRTWTTGDADWDVTGGTPPSMGMIVFIEAVT